MKEYTLSELLNSTFDGYYEFGDELKGLNDSIKEKPKHRNLQLNVKPNYNDDEDKDYDNVIFAYWDNHGPKLKRAIWFLENLGIITTLDKCYHHDIKSDGKKVDYPEFVISDIEKWNYYYNLLKSNEFVKNLDLFSYNSGQDKSHRELHGDSSYISASRAIPYDPNPHSLILTDKFTFFCDEPYQIQYMNPNIEKLTIDEVNRFLHTYTLDDNIMSDYLRRLLDKNNGNEFNLYNNLENYKIDNESKTMSLKLIKR